MLAAVTALSLSACTNQDADIDDVRDALEEADLNREQVRSCTNAFEDADFSQDDLNEIADAETLDDLPNDLGEQVNTLLRQCIEDSSTTTTEASGESDESGETTTTTAG